MRLNDGAGTFTDAGLTLVTSGSARTVAIGDLDGDGDLDAVFGTTSGDTVYFRE